MEPLGHRIRQALTDVPQPVDVIAAKLGVSVQQAHAELALLEDLGLARSVVEGWATRAE